jgi:hypothetical protein
MSSKQLYTCKKCGKEFKKSKMSKNLQHCITCTKIDNNLLNIRILHNEKHKIDNDISHLRQEINELQVAAELTG